MNIRSIDLQVLISQTSAVSKIQHATEQQHTAQQHHFAAQWQKLSQDRQHQVQVVNQSEGGRIREQDTSEKRRNQDDANDQQHSREDNDMHYKSQLNVHTALQTDPIRGKNLDIKT